jgi:hypothetical protein
MTKPFTVATDASPYAIGMVLFQEGQTGLQPVAFASRKLTSAEIGYGQFDKEALALVESFRIFRPYLHGNDKV